jgi:hypothetical protein
MEQKANDSVIKKIPALDDEDLSSDEHPCQ